MRKKVAIWLGIFILTASVTIVSAQVIRFNNNEDTLQVRDVNGEKVLLPELSQQELQSIAESDIDQLIQDPNQLDILLKSSPIRVMNADGTATALETTKLELKYEGQTIFVDRTIVKDAILLTVQKGKPGLELVPSNDYKLYTFSSPTNDIFTIDSDTLEINKISAEQIEGYSKQELLGRSWKAGTLMWAYEPMISSDHQLVSYLSNRRAIQSDDNRDDIWVINLISGQEKLLIKNGRTLFWDNRSIYYLDTIENNIARYDYDTDTTKVLISDIELYQSLNRKWIAYSRPYDQSAYFYNIANGESVVLDVNPSSRVTFNFQLSPDEKKVLGTTFVDRTVTDSRHFLIFDLMSQQFDLLEIPAEKPQLVEIQGWIDNERFVATVRSNDERSTKSILVNSTNGEVE